MNGAYGITITGNVAVITLSVPALWLLAITVLSGIFMTYSTVRDWLAGLFARIAQEHGIERDAPSAATGPKIWE